MARPILILILAAVVAPAFSAHGQQVPDKRPTKIWNRTGPLGDTPKHVTDAYPLVRPAEQGRLGEVSSR